jgi:hypothetical protein
LAFRELVAGQYVADVILPEPGQWELTITAAAEGSRIAATRRVIVH